MRVARETPGMKRSRERRKRHRFCTYLVAVRARVSLFPNYILFLKITQREKTPFHSRSIGVVRSGNGPLLVYDTDRRV